MTTLKIKPNKGKRHFTIHKYLNGKFFKKYKSEKFTPEQFRKT